MTRPRCAGAALAGDLRWTSDDPFERAAAAVVCRGCEVRASCLAGARARGETQFVWGGVDLTPERPKPPPMATPDEPQVVYVRAAVRGLAAHGTRKRYQQGCHCEPCTKANTARVAQHREKRKFEPPKPQPPRAVPQSMFAEIPAVTARKRVRV